LSTAPETIERVFKPIQQFTRGWMMAEATHEYGKSLGLTSGTQFRVVGRGGVLGSCPPEVADAAMAFHNPDEVHELWTSLPDGLTHFEVSKHYMSRITKWGEEALTGVFEPDRLEVIDVMGRRIADAAPACLGAMFAGWRAMPQPEDLGARVALTTHLLREMRNAAHISAVNSVGITPLDAILASTNAPPRTGPGYAKAMGFSPPFRDPEEVRPQRLEAEVITARILEPYFAVLSSDELAQFGEVVETTRNAIDM
jgi:hypothetical protein